MTTYPLSTKPTDKISSDALMRQRMETIIRLAHTMPSTTRFELIGIVEKLSDTEFAQTEEGQALTNHFNATINLYFEKNRMKKQKNRKTKQK